MLDNQEFDEIQKSYKRQKLKESLAGVSISTLLHIAAVFAFVILVVPKKVIPKAQIEMKLVDTPKSQEIATVPRKLDIGCELPGPSHTQSSFTPHTNTINIDLTSLTEISTARANEPEIPNVFREASDNKPVLVGAQIRGDVLIQQQLSKHRATDQGQASLAKGLDWLAKNQHVDGSWGNNGVTGLALLAYLARGETPKSKKYGSTVAKAMQFLATKDKSSTAFHGYPHAIKTYALAEAYLFTHNYALLEPIKSCGAQVISGIQDSGSYDYNYKDSARWDNSFSFWNYQALKALKLTEIDMPGLDSAIQKARFRLKEMAKYQFPYSGTDEAIQGRGNVGLAAAGLMCLQLFKEDSKYDKEIAKRLASEGLRELEWENGPKKWAMYSWYYQTFALFGEGGRDWKKWNVKFQRMLNENQNGDGSWSHVNAWGSGREIESKAYQTALASLMMTVYYRQAGLANLNHEQRIFEEEDLEIF